MNSSDCVANENECRDSEGKRVRSSPKANVGDPGAVCVDSEGCLDTGGVARFSEAARWVVCSCLGPGCWRMRRRPEDPRPCSCSDTMGDLEHGCQPLPTKRRKLLPAQPLARCTHLAMRSSCPASMLKRLAVSMGGGGPVRQFSRLDVLFVLTSGAYSERC
jgi:hypothetical protein